jgi:membrane protein DedA with SNARE-associated domain/rhodanese-related sulfurtransferase
MAQERGSIAMAHDIILLISGYGLLLVFVNVLLEQLGLPLPAVPTLVIAGALAANGTLPLVELMLVALVACLLGDSLWFIAGRHFGSRVMSTICRISLSPDSCVKKSELRFLRWRARMLLVAKFVPGLSTVAPPLAGAMGLTWSPFLVFDAIGSLIWAGIAVSVGYLFAGQIDHLLDYLQSAGTVAMEVVLCLLAIYIGVKWWQRHRLLRSLRMSRMTVQDLYRAMQSGGPPLIVDVRSAAARLMDDRTIPGALLADLGGIDQAVRDIPLDREMVIYCTCPNEVSAAKAAKTLMDLGYRRVRPLLGGLDAWDQAGYLVQRLESPVGDPVVQITIG